MSPGGELGDNAAETAVERDLGGQGLAQDPATILDDSRSGLVTGGLEG